VVSQNGRIPDPDTVTELDGFIDLLGELRAWAGLPAYRSLAKRVGPLMRPPQSVSATTVVDAFRIGRRRLDMDLVLAIVRALGVTGDADLARWRAALVRANLAARVVGPVATPRQLPADLTTFTGRTQALADLFRVVESAPDTVVIAAIEGMAGVGKTQLAVHAAHQLARAGRVPDIQLYVNLRGFDAERPPADPADVLDAFLRALQVSSKQIPAGTDERAAMFRSLLHDRRALLLLDNAADEEQVRDLIPAGPGCVVLITSRRSMAGLDGCVALGLDVFAHSEGVDLLAAIAGRDRIDAEPEAAEEVVDLCGRLPLAVSLAAGRLRSRPGWSVRDLAGRLTTGGLDAVAAGGRSLRPVFDLSYGSLPDPARRMFRLLGLHPGVDFTTEAAAAVADVDASVAVGLLELLQDEHLVRAGSGRRYELHDLLRLYALDRCPAEGDPERVAAEDRLLEHYVHTAYRAAMLQFPKRYAIPLPVETTPPALVPLADADAASQWLEAELGSLQDLTVSAVERHPTASWQLAWAQIGHQTKTGRYREMIVTQTAALQAAEHLGHLQAQAFSLDRRQWALCGTSELDDAATDARRAIEVCRALDDGLFEARILCGLSGIDYQRGDYSPALESARRALELTRSPNTPVQRATEAQALNLIAWSMAHLGEGEAAVPFGQEAMALFEDDNDLWGRATAADTLAYCYQVAGRYPDAVAMYERALDFRTEFDAPVLRATTLLRLAELHQLLGDIVHARKTLEEAAELAAGSGSWVVGSIEELLSQLIEQS
jgi:tetratricopeptide (TPR) repeat protein